MIFTKSRRGKLLFLWVLGFSVIDDLHRGAFPIAMVTGLWLTTFLKLLVWFWVCLCELRHLLLVNPVLGCPGFALLCSGCLALAKDTISSTENNFQPRNIKLPHRLVSDLIKKRCTWDRALVLSEITVHGEWFANLLYEGSH